MDDLLEHQRRQEEDEFWDEKQRDAARPKNGRSRDLSTFFDEASPAMKSTPVQEDLREETRDRVDGAPVFRDPALQRPADKKRSMGLLWVVALLVLGALGYQGYRMWQKREAAAQTTGAMEVASQAEPALPAVLGSSPLPLPAVAPIQPVVPEPPAGPTPEQIELNARLDHMETRLNQVIEGLRAQGYIIGEAGANGEPLLPTAFAPHQVTPPARARPAPVRRSAPKAPVVKAPAVTRQQLLSVDMWDGRPSVVVGNGDQENPQVKVLQQGDSFNGITLNSVDVAGQRATFTDGARSISLDVSN